MLVEQRRASLDPQDRVSQLRADLEAIRAGQANSVDLWLEIEPDVFYSALHRAHINVDRLNGSPIALKVSFNAFGGHIPIRASMPINDKIFDDFKFGANSVSRRAFMDSLYHIVNAEIGSANLQESAANTGLYHQADRCDIHTNIRKRQRKHRLDGVLLPITRPWVIDAAGSRRLVNFDRANFVGIEGDECSPGSTEITWSYVVDNLHVTSHGDCPNLQIPEQPLPFHTHRINESNRGRELISFLKTLKFHNNEKCPVFLNWRNTNKEFLILNPIVRTMANNIQIDVSVARSQSPNALLFDPVYYGATHARREALLTKDVRSNMGRTKPIEMERAVRLLSLLRSDHLIPFVIEDAQGVPIAKSNIAVHLDWRVFGAGI